MARIMAKTRGRATQYRLNSHTCICELVESIRRPKRSTACSQHRNRRRAQNWAQRNYRQQKPFSVAQRNRLNTKKKMVPGVGVEPT
jgi:hypothetical protein